ncbi:hypothetical protein Q8F55_006653 [Vanrija albida]|uniref:BTB domain-containing protein n=1 Tax=Vanrija albida TaxID=181172 RepID=A0ABR3PY44_9TREE
MCIKPRLRLWRFHRDFAHPPTPCILKSSDGTHFFFPLDDLAAVSPFFQTIATLPTPPGDNVIPLYSAQSDALALALQLVRWAVHPHRAAPAPSLRWPSRHLLHDLSVIIDVYDLDIVADTLLAVTRPDDPLASPRVCYERVVWAATVGVKDLHTVARATALHRVEDQDKWVLDALSKLPDALHHIDSWRGALESVVQGCVAELRTVATQLACSPCFFNHGDRLFYRWGWHRRRYPGCDRAKSAGHWSREEIDDWFSRLADRLRADITARPPSPRVAGDTFSASLVISLDKFYRDVEELVPEVHLPRWQIDRTARQSWVKTYPPA